MTDYSKMSDVDIAVQVGKHVSKDGQSLVGINGKACIHEYQPPVGGVGEMCLGWVEFAPCNSWADVGPIIQKNTIQLTSDGYEWLAIDFFERFDANHENPLRAACIVFLMMKEAEKGRGNG